MCALFETNCTNVAENSCIALVTSAQFLDPVVQLVTAELSVMNCVILRLLQKIFKMKGY